MVDSSRRSGRQCAPRQLAGVHVDGLALRYVLILCDTVVSDASYGVCYKDEITLGLPEGRLVIRFAQRARRHLLLAFEVDFRSPGGGIGWRASWDVTVTGEPGTGGQRAAIVQEITRLRDYYARIGKAAEPAAGRPVPPIARCPGGGGSGPWSSGSGPAGWQARCGRSSVCGRSTVPRWPDSPGKEQPGKGGAPKGGAT